MIKAIAIDDEPPALSVIESLCRRNADIVLDKAFTLAGEAIKHLKKYPVDLIFCDIQMPSISGMSLIKSLPKPPLVIFTTAFSHYAAESYELNAIDYLLKPINQKRFDSAVEKAKKHLQYFVNANQSTEANLFIRADFSLIKIPLAEILYVEGMADYLKIHIFNRKTVVARMTMKDILEKLAPADFIRIHRSIIIPFQRIESVRGMTVLCEGREFPIGKTYAANFFSRYSIS